MDMIKICSVEPEYDKYAHIIGLNIKLKNECDNSIKVFLGIGATSKARDELFEKKGENTQKEGVIIKPGEEKMINLPINPAVLIHEEGSFSIL